MSDTHYKIINKKYKSINDIQSIHKTTGVRLDLGCGYSKPKGFIGIDNLLGCGSQIIIEDNAPDILMDINIHCLPFLDESCVEIRASHFLEHSNLDHVINETYRLLRPGGLFYFVVPYANSAEGMYPGHSIFLTEKWFQNNINFQDKFLIIDEE